VEVRGAHWALEEPRCGATSMLWSPTKLPPTPHHNPQASKQASESKSVRPIFFLGTDSNLRKCTKHTYHYYVHTHNESFFSGTNSNLRECSKHTYCKSVRPILGRNLLWMALQTYKGKDLLWGVFCVLNIRHFFVC